MSQPTLEYARELDGRVVEAVGAMDRAVRDRGLTFWEAYQSSCGTEGRVTFGGHANMGDVLTAIRDEAGRIYREQLSGLSPGTPAYEKKAQTPECVALKEVYAKASAPIARFIRETEQRAHDFRLAETGPHGVK